MADTKTPERNMGIELLRMIAMLMIMVLHVLGQGGILKNLTPMSGSYIAGWLMETIAYPGVCVFGLISGYVGLDRQHRVSDAVHIWIWVLFYTILGSVVFFILIPGSMTYEAIMNMFFPVMSESYWYVSAYIGVFFFMNGINHVVNNMPQRQLGIMFTAAMMLFCILPVFFYTDVFALRQGCSIICVGCFYFVGAYMKKFGIMKKTGKIRLWILFVSCIIAVWGFKIAGEAIFGFDPASPDRFNRLYTYYSFPVLLAGMCLVAIFSNIRVSGAVSKTIRMCAPLTFGVYLINAQPMVFKYLMADRFAAYAENGPVILMIRVLLAALCIYLCGTASDAIRRLIFSLIGVKERLKAIENKLYKEDKNG